jgi:hypothetical protein
MQYQIFYQQFLLDKDVLIPNNLYLVPRYLVNKKSEINVKNKIVHILCHEMKIEIINKFIIGTEDNVYIYF